MRPEKQSTVEILFLSFMQFLRPLLGPEGMCIFHPYTCTLFAADQLRTQPFVVACLRIIWRLLSCNPINGYLRWRALRTRLSTTRGPQKKFHRQTARTDLLQAPVKALHGPRQR